MACVNSESTGLLIKCIDKSWTMQQDGGGEHRTPDQSVSANQGNQATTTENDTIQKDAENTRSKGFFGENTHYVALYALMYF